MTYLCFEDFWLFFLKVKKIYVITSQTWLNFVPPDLVRKKLDSRPQCLYMELTRIYAFGSIPVFCLLDSSTNVNTLIWNPEKKYLDSRRQISQFQWEPFVAIPNSKNFSIPISNNMLESRLVSYIKGSRQWQNPNCYID